MHLDIAEAFDWFHDCELVRVVYDMSDFWSKSLSLTLQCPGNIGYVPLAGKRVTLLAKDVYAFRYLAWGYVAGADMINSIHFGVSSDFHEKIVPSESMGIVFPHVRVTVNCHSGSVFEIVCAAIECDEVNE